MAQHFGKSNLSLFACAMALAVSAPLARAEAGYAETVLYSFQGGDDGAFPQGSLIDVDGTLYGTTGAGGANNAGTVFSITPGGAESVLYSFKGGDDGAFPQAGLIEVDGAL